MLEIVTTRGGGRKAVSVGGSVTGHGADIIIVDDCLKADDARSEAKRHEAKEWFNGTLATRLNDVGGGAIISISQRLHEDDLAAHLLDKGYELLCLPAIAERDERIAIGPEGIVRPNAPIIRGGPIGAANAPPAQTSHSVSLLQLVA